MLAAGIDKSTGTSCKVISSSTNFSFEPASLCGNVVRTPGRCQISMSNLIKVWGSRAAS